MYLYDNSNHTYRCVYVSVCVLVSYVQQAKQGDVVMYEVIVLIDNVVCVSIPVVCSKDKAASKAISMCISRGYKQVILVGIKGTMVRVGY